MCYGLSSFNLVNFCDDIQQQATDLVIRERHKIIYVSTIEKVSYGFWAAYGIWLKLLPAIGT